MTRSHLEHLLALHDAGAVVLPASPGFYGAGAAATAAEQLVDFVAGKVLDAIGVPHTLFRRWAGELGATGAHRRTSRTRTDSVRPRVRRPVPARWAGPALRGRPARAVIHVVEHAFALEQGAYLGFPEPAMAAWRPDAADPSGGRPSRHGLRVDPEQRSHLARRQQTISSVHSPLLASTKPPGWPVSPVRCARAS